MEIVQSGPGRSPDGSPVSLVLGSPGDLSPVFRGFDGACRWCVSGVWHTLTVHRRRVAVSSDHAVGMVARWSHADRYTIVSVLDEGLVAA